MSEITEVVGKPCRQIGEGFDADGGTVFLVELDDGELLAVMVPKNN